MKKGWTYKKIGDVFRTYAGGTPSKSNKANYENGSIPWIRSGEVCQKYITESELCISEEGLKNSSAKYYPIDTVLVAMYGATAAQCGILKFEATSNQAVCGILPKEDFSPEFVYAYFTYIKDDLSAQAQGGAQPNISQEKIKKVLFPCIPLSEQHTIVSRLDVAFANIDALKANAEKQLSDARQLFQAELTECMRPKEGWEEKKLEDVCAITSLLVNPVEEQYKKLLHVGGANIISESDILVDLKTAEEESLISGKFLFDTEDVLYNKIRPYLKKVARPDFSGLCSADMYPLRHKDSITRDFLYYVLITKDFTDYAILNSGRAGMPKVNRQAVFAYNFFLPPIEIQHQIVSRLDVLSARVKQLEEVQRKTMEECDALKQAMLREVFE